MIATRNKAPFRVFGSVDARGSSTRDWGSHQTLGRDGATAVPRTRSLPKSTSEYLSEVFAHQKQSGAVRNPSALSNTAEIHKQIAQAVLEAITKRTAQVLETLSEDYRVRLTLTLQRLSNTMRELYKVLENIPKPEDAPSDDFHSDETSFFKADRSKYLASQAVKQYVAQFDADY